MTNPNNIPELPLAKKVLIFLKVAKMQAMKDKVGIDKTDGWTRAIETLKGSLQPKRLNIEVELAALESIANRAEEKNAERLAMGLSPIDDETPRREFHKLHDEFDAMRMMEKRRSAPKRRARGSL